MALAQDEPISIRVIRSTWVDVQFVEVERNEHVGDRQWAADVSRAGRVDGLKDEPTCATR
jgi:hypothetical protein